MPSSRTLHLQHPREADQSIRQVIDSRLYVILAERSFSASVAHALSLTFLFGLAVSKIGFKFEMFLCALAVAASSALRYYSSKKLLLDPKHSSYRKMFAVAVIAQASSWALFMAGILVARGISDLLTVIALLFGSSIAAGSTSSLGPSIRLCQWFLSILVGGVVLALNLYHAEESVWLTINLVLFMWFNFRQARSQYETVLNAEYWKARAQQSTIELRALFDTVPAQISVISSDLRYIDTNNFAASKFFKHSNIIGASVGSVEACDEFAAFLKELKHRAEPHSASNADQTFEVDGLGAEIPVATREITLRESTGKSTQWLLRGAAYEANQMGHFVVTALDVTNLKDAQNKLIAEQDKIARLERTASIGELAAGLAHEINNPLTIAFGQINLIGRKYQEAGVDLKGVEVNLRRIAGVVSGFNKFGRLDFQSKVEIENIIDEMVKYIALIYPELSKNGLRIYRKRESRRVAAQLYLESFMAAISAVIMQLAFECGKRDASLMLDAKMERINSLEGASGDIAIIEMTLSVDIPEATMWNEISYGDVSQSFTGYHWLGSTIIKDILERHHARLRMERVADGVTATIAMAVNSHQTKKAVNF